MERSPNILVIEDNPGDVQLIKENFKLLSSKARFTVARDGEEGLQMLMDGKAGKAPLPDIIILDLNLPRKDGREVLRDVKNDMRLRLIPIVIFSSSGAEEEVENAYLHHANCYVVKPDDFEGYKKAMDAINRFWLNTASKPDQSRPRPESDK